MCDCDGSCVWLLSRSLASPSTAVDQINHISWVCRGNHRLPGTDAQSLAEAGLALLHSVCKLLAGGDAPEVLLAPCPHTQHGVPPIAWNLSILIQSITKRGAVANSSGATSNKKGKNWLSLKRRRGRNHTSTLAVLSLNYLCGAGRPDKENSFHTRLGDITIELRSSPSRENSDTKGKELMLSLLTASRGRWPT